MVLEVQCTSGAVVTGEAFLGRDAWTEVGLALLIREGIDAVKITRLAESLAVTRGSFYWHFKDRDDLLESLIRRWQGTNTRAVVEVMRSSDDLAMAILGLFDCWMDAERFDPGLDSAMRDWARCSGRVKRAVKRADDRRVAAIAEVFERSGYEPTDGFIRARILYFAQVGYYALDIRETMERRFAYLEAYYRGFTGRELDPALAEAHRAKHGRG